MHESNYMVKTISLAGTVDPSIIGTILITPRTTDFSIVEIVPITLETTNSSTIEMVSSALTRVSDP